MGIFADNLNVPIVFHDNTLYDGESEAGPLPNLFGGVKRFKNIRQYFGGYARAVV